MGKSVPSDNWFKTEFLEHNVFIGGALLVSSHVVITLQYFPKKNAGVAYIFWVLTIDYFFFKKQGLFQKVHFWEFSVYWPLS